MIRFAAMLWAFAALAACSAREAEAPPPPVQDPATKRAVSTGTLIGYTDAETSAHVWRAAPFAAAPIGDLRWRAPRPAEPWEGERAALEPAPWCPQIIGPLDGVDEDRYGELAGQEDCLYADIYAPAMDADEAAGADLPVMMWIHGGSNVWGRAEQYNAGALAERHNVIVVVVQYRLGPLGWFAHPALADDGDLDADASPNFGTLDQIAALEWIRDEIGAFGGDPDRVTIFGESAGGHNVAALLSSPLASGLFHRAIIQSGSFASIGLDDAQSGDRPDSGKAIADALNASTGDALRAVPVEAVYAAYDTTRGEFDPPRIIEDGIVLPAGGVEEAFDSADTFNAVPIITGTNRDEMKLFNILNPELSRLSWGVIPQWRDKVLYSAMSDYPSRMWRVRAVDDQATSMTAGGHDAVWAYRFDWDEAGRVWFSDFAKLLGAAHSIEIPFVFGRFQFLGEADRWVFTAKNEAGRIALSDAMMSYWANFAHTGEPGRGVDGDLPLWSPWPADASGETLMIFDSPAGGGVRMEADVETAREVADDVLADTRLEKKGYTCRVYTATAAWSPDLDATRVDACP